MAGRRKTLAWVAGVLLVSGSDIYADDALLDPASLFKKPTGPVPSSRLTNSATTKSSSDARGMAVAVVSAVQTLAGAVAERAMDVDRLTKRASALNSEIPVLESNMERVLDEYRQGLFCSGCGKTKSQILAQGDRFPHPGQTIVRATAAQIEAKEMELQAPITRDRRELTDIEAKCNKAKAERDEATAQIEAGVALWITCISFENLLIDVQERRAEAAYEAEKARLEQKLTSARLEKPRSGASVPTAAISNLEDALLRLKVQWVKTRRDIGKSRANAADSSSADQVALNDYLSRDVLRPLNLPLVRVFYASQSAGFNALGGMFRMGAFNVEHFSEPQKFNDTLPQVEVFVREFQQAPPPKPALPAPSGEPLDSVRKKILENLKQMGKCDSKVDVGCFKNSTDGGSGIRG